VRRGEDEADRTRFFAKAMTRVAGRDGDDVGGTGADGVFGSCL
jgi:hypothetical protein